MAIAAVTVLVAPVVQFRRHHTTVDPRADAAPSSLVIDGVNAYTRNPMYVGMAGLLLAVVVRGRTLRASIPLLGFVAWIDRRQVLIEEAALLAQFGADFDQYRSQVPRWIGMRRTQPVHSD